MDKRLKIALNYRYDENWIGGTYYIENLISALNTLPIEDKPVLFIVSEYDDYCTLAAKVDYPFISYHNSYGPRNLFLKVANKITRKLFGLNVFGKKNTVDVLFPFSSPIAYLTSKKNIYWIPDFQEHYFPKFFSEKEAEQRKQWQASIINSKNQLILSSKAAYSNYKEIFPKTTLEPFILPFAVTLPNIFTIDFSTVKKDLGLTDEYFICPNQFWIHKDHKTLIKAISHLKNKGQTVTVYFTGKTEDHRFPGYYKELESMINELGLQGNIISLGFLDRRVQLAVMKNALAIIQPSLFEGWSTVIEDAKALNKFVIASDIEVHKEQLENYNAVIFESGNSNSLAEKISTSVQENHFDSNYQENIATFGKEFLTIVNHRI